MKNIIFLLFVLSIVAIETNAQKAKIIGRWQLSKVVTDDKVYENLSAVYIFEKKGVLKAAQSEESEEIESGKWEFNKKKHWIIMSSHLSDKDFNGTATVIKLSKTELVYKKDNATLYFNRIPNLKEVSHKESIKTKNSIYRLKFTEEEFYDNNGEYKYYDDESKLPWKDTDKMLMSLVNVKQLVYKCSTLEEDAISFKEEILRADVKSNPADLVLSIDNVFNGFDRYNLPEDAEFPSNTEYTKALYPEEDKDFRVVGTEQITIEAGTFDCTVVEFIGHSEIRKKLWMINDKPGIYAKVIVDKAGMFGMYLIYELQEIKMVE